MDGRRTSNDDCSDIPSHLNAACTSSMLLLASTGVVMGALGVRASPKIDTQNSAKMHYKTLYFHTKSENSLAGGTTSYSKEITRPFTVCPQKCLFSSRY